MTDRDVTLGGQVIELVEPNRFAPVTRPVPEAGPGEVVVEMRALGLCGTDLHMFGGRGDKYPHVVGHDGAAVVIAIGEGVAETLRGARVTIDPLTRCGECPACRRGVVQLCPNGGYLGMLGPGILGQYVRLSAAQAIPLPDNVTDAAATVLEPVAVALHTLDRIAPSIDGPWPTAVVGGGPLGILLALVFEHAGHACTVFEPEQSRRDLGTSLGVTMTPAEPIELPSGPRIIVETSAARAGVALADELATPGSVVAMVGRAPESIAPASVLLKELTLIGVRGGPGKYEDAVRLVSEGTIDTEKVVTHRFSWNEAEAAFRMNIDQPGTVVRALLTGEW
jgi:threonine dehydrogenase-like Zn-dependent dehydrogenase